MFGQRKALLRTIPLTWYADTSKGEPRRATAHFLLSRPFLKTYLLFLENDQKTQRK